MKTRKKFLITGHPRSGTTYMATVMREAGFHIGHETIGMDGIASWMFAVDDYQEWKDPSLNRKNFKFDHVIMCVRDPMKMLASVIYTERASIDFRRRHIEFPDEEPAGSILSIIQWYALIKGKGHDVVAWVETPARLYGWLREQGYDIPDDLQPPTKVVNAREHEDVTWETLRKYISTDLMRSWLNFCHEHGYYLEREV